MENPKLDIIDFKNRRWLFLILIPLFFGLFIITFMVYFYIRNNENSFGFLLTSIIFFIETQLIIKIFSKLRFVPNGKLIFDEKGVIYIKSTGSEKISWENIKDIQFYYRGDRFWKTKIGKININHGRSRYNNLHWGLTNDMDEKRIDRIDINGAIIYVKIRNEKEKTIFFKLITFSRKYRPDIKLIETDFTTKLFGRTIKY